MENASCNNDPLTIVDIGASGGIHARWSALPCGLRAVLFEPDPREFDTLTSMAPDNWTVINSALSDRSGDIEFRLARKQPVSSVYPPNRAILEKCPDPERFHTVKTIKIRADTLDNQLKANGIQDVDFIKIDAEGYALPILKGGGESFRAVIVYLSYGYFDLAEVLSRSAGAKGLLSSATSAKIETMLNKRRNKARLPDFRGKGRIHDVLARIADVFAVGGEGGAYSGTDPKVGNL